MRIFIIGCQYTGLSAAKFWKSRGHFVTVTTTRESRVAELSAQFDKVVVMRGSDVETMQSILPEQDAVLMSVAGGMIEKDGKVVLDADAYTDTYLGTAKNIVEALKNSPSVKHIIFPSSTSAYGDGFSKDSVTEDDKTNPASIFQTVYVETESVLLSAESDTRKVCILRTGNIYGIGRELKTQATATRRERSSISSSPRARSGAGLRARRSRSQQATTPSSTATCRTATRRSSRPRARSS